MKKKKYDGYIKLLRELLKSINKPNNNSVTNLKYGKGEHRV